MSTTWMLRIGGVALGLGLSVLAAATPAAAHGHTSLGVSIGVPIYPYGDSYYRHSYRPPNVYYPPATVYYPPPATVYVPAPQQPAVSVSPADRGFCREYQSKAVIAGKSQPTHGTACRQPDGSWRIIN